MFPPIKDFLSLSGLISAFSVLLGSAIGIHGLRRPRMSKGRRLAVLAYVEGVAKLFGRPNITR